MNDVTFNPDSWINASERMQNASDAFWRSAHPVVVARTISAFSLSPVDGAVRDGDGPLIVKWYELIGKGVEALNSDASKMSATGSNYQAMEERGTRAAERFWG